MPLVRSIGRWAMTALVINCIVGSGIFGVPGELSRLLGRASPLVMIVGALTMAIIMACFTEVGSQFSEAGGPYLYLRTAYGPFAGLQVGWFHFLALTGGGAGNVVLLVNYLGSLVPPVAHGWPRILVTTLIVLSPAFANYRGVQSGANLATLLTVAKLLPLGLLIVLGISRFSLHFEMIRPSEITSPGWGAWLSAVVLLVYAYDGCEDALLPLGEVKEPRRTVPFALGAGLLTCALVYALLQLVTVTTVGATASDRPLADAASVLVGRTGAGFVTIAVIISTYGWISGGMLTAPRLPYSLAVEGDLPAVIGRLHPTYQTPTVTITLYAALVWLLALSGAFLWVAALTAGSAMIMYCGVCAALIRLRRRDPSVAALRVPFGSGLAVIGILISMALLSQLEVKQLLLMGITGLLATANWAWARRQRKPVLSLAGLAASPEA